MSVDQVELGRVDDLLSQARRVLVDLVGLEVAQVLRQDVGPVGVVDRVGEELPVVVVGTGLGVGQGAGVEELALVAHRVVLADAVVGLTGGRVVRGLEDLRSRQADLAEDLAPLVHALGSPFLGGTRQGASDLHEGLVLAVDGWGLGVVGGRAPRADELEVVGGDGVVGVVQGPELVGGAVLNDRSALVHRILQDFHQLRGVLQSELLGCPVVLSALGVDVLGHHRHLEGHVLTVEVVDDRLQLLGVAVRGHVLQTHSGLTELLGTGLEEVQEDVGSRDVPVLLTQVGQRNLTDEGHSRGADRPGEGGSAGLCDGGARGGCTVGLGALSTPQDLDVLLAGDVRSDDATGVELVALQGGTVVADLGDPVGGVDVGGGSVPAVALGESGAVGVGLGQLPDVEAGPHDGDVAGQGVIDEGPRQGLVVGGADVDHVGEATGQAGDVVLDREGRHGPGVAGQGAHAQGVVLPQLGVVTGGVEQDQGRCRPRLLVGEAHRSDRNLGRVLLQVADLDLSCGGRGLVEIHVGLLVALEGELLLGRGGRLGRSRKRVLGRVGVIGLGPAGRLGCGGLDCGRHLRAGGGCGLSGADCGDGAAQAHRDGGQRTAAASCGHKGRGDHERSFDEVGTGSNSGRGTPRPNRAAVAARMRLHACPSP